MTQYAVIRKKPGKIPHITRCDFASLKRIVRECRRLYPDADVVVAWVDDAGLIQVESSQDV